MKLTKLTSLLVLLLCLNHANAQSNIEYGELSELNGVRKIYVDTGTDLSGRENIINIIRKELNNVVVVSHVEEAEVVLIYSSDSYRILDNIVQTRNSTTDGKIYVYGNQGRYSEQTNSTSVTRANYRKITDGAGLVVSFPENGRSRLLMDFKDTKSTLVERRPSTNFARKFVKAYKQVNGESLRDANSVSLAQSVQAVSAIAFDLNGTWNYNNGPVQVTQQGAIVKVAYASPSACNSTMIADFLEGKIDGSLFAGKMSICTNEKLVNSCRFPAVSQIPFTATVDHDRLEVTATIPGMSISYGNDGQCKVTNDNRQSSSFKSVLTRVR